MSRYHEAPDEEMVSIPASMFNEMSAHIEAQSAELSRLSALVAELNRTIERRDRSSETSRKFWIRAAKAALAGDTRELRNRVELAESAPVEIVLSESAPAPPVSQLKDTTNADK